MQYHQSNGRTLIPITISNRAYIWCWWEPKFEMGWPANQSVYTLVSQMFSSTNKFGLKLHLLITRMLILVIRIMFLLTFLQGKTIAQLDRDDIVGSASWIVDNCNHKFNIGKNDHRRAISSGKTLCHYGGSLQTWIASNSSETARSHCSPGHARTLVVGFGSFGVWQK